MRAFHYRPPPVKKGEPLPIPETRSEVVDKMLARLAADTAPAIRQDYSNGEFSLIVGRTFEAVAARELELEVPDSTAHYDAALDLWWRHGGSFD